MGILHKLTINIHFMNAAIKLPTILSGTDLKNIF